MFVQGSHTFAMFYAHALRDKREYTIIVHTHYIYLHPICSKEHCRQYACIVWLYYAQLSLTFMHGATGYGGYLDFFLLSVSAPLDVGLKRCLESSSSLPKFSHSAKKV